MADGDILGIGTKTIGESYQKMLHTGDDNGVGYSVSPICTSNDSTTDNSALWLGKIAGGNQMALVKAVGPASEFFAIQNAGSDISTNSSILSAFDSSGTDSGRGHLLLRQELHVSRGTTIPDSNDYPNIEHGIIEFKDGTYKHSIYSAGNRTIFDNGHIHGMAVPQGNFKFLDVLEIGDNVTLGKIGGVDGKVQSLSVVTGELTTSEDFALSADANATPTILSAADLEIAASDGMKIGTSGATLTPTVDVESKDGTESKISLNALATSTANTAINIGTQSLAVAASTGTQLVTIGDFHGTPANNLHANASYVELALKSPKTKFYTGSIFAKVNTYDGSGNLCFPDFAVDGVAGDEGVLSFQGIDPESTHTVTSKISDEDRNVVLYTDANATYEIDKYDITKGRKTFYKKLAGVAGTDAPDVPAAVGDVTVYAKADRYNILALDSNSTAAFYLDLDNGAGGAGVAGNTIQEAQPAALTSSDAVGSPTQGEYDALRADVVALRSTVEALMTELKTFRLWKENSGVAV